MKKRNFSAEFKRESAQLALDQNYTVAAAANAMGVGLSTMNFADGEALPAARCSLANASYTATGKTLWSDPERYAVQ